MACGTPAIAFPFGVLDVYEALAKEQVLSSGGAALPGLNARRRRTAGKRQSAP